MPTPSVAWLGEVTPGAIGIWSLLAVVSVALIKAWPVLALQAQTARDKLRGETRSDLSDCKERIDKLQAELGVVKDNVHSLELKLLGALSANRILDLELSTHLPDSSALKQARAVLSAAFALSPSTEPPMEMPEGLR